MQEDFKGEFTGKTLPAPFGLQLPHRDDENDQSVVFDRVDHAVVAHPDAVQLLLAGELSHAARTRLLTQGIDPGRQANLNGSGRLWNSRAARCEKRTL